MAVARYERMSAAVAALTELASGPDEARLAAVLTGDDVVLARMRAAAAVLADLPADLPGLPDPADCTEADLLTAATGWQRYAKSSVARGPVGELSRACAVDVARGLVRLWSSRQASTTGPLARRMRLRQSRIALLGRVRARCAALRTELRDDAAVLTRRRAGGFVDHVARRVVEVAAELADEVDWELTGGPDADLPEVAVPPPPHRVGGEMRLTGLLGAAFGLGAALTLIRMLGALLPGYPGAAVGLGIAAGLGLGGWVVAARRLLVRRAALDRWVTEVTAGLRAALEERVAIRVLAAEAVEAHRVNPDRRGRRPV